MKDELMLKSRKWINIESLTVIQCHFQHSIILEWISKQLLFYQTSTIHDTNQLTFNKNYKMYGSWHDLILDLIDIHNNTIHWTIRCRCFDDLIVVLYWHEVSITQNQLLPGTRSIVIKVDIRLNVSCFDVIFGWYLVQC